MPRIMTIDDSSTIRSIITKQMVDLGFEVDHAEDGQQGLTKLEEIANGFPGVEKSNVIQAGREVRVVVTPERIDDAAAAQLSDTIARRIENELQYPGQIKVVVIRETRAVDYAR